MSDLLPSSLTEAQRAAIEHVGGPLLIVAGPGAGKTDVMVRRTAYLVLERGVAPENLLVTTFTNKAADELYDRLYPYLLDDGRVHNEARALICQALAYFVTPFDVLPEEVHGAEGYLDQVYLCLWVIGRLRRELPEHVLEEAWEGEGDLSGLVHEALPKVQTAVGAEARAKVLRYVGLAERAGTGAAR